jgi:hypothetical protein
MSGKIYQSSLMEQNKTHKSIILSACLLAGMLVAPSAHASRSMEAPICSVQGVVLEQDKRMEKGQGMSEGEKFYYQDLKVKVLSLDYADEDQKNFAGTAPPFSCEYNPDFVNVYQNRDFDTAFEWMNFFRAPKNYEGECISAKTQFFADGNFKSGNWIYDIKVLEDEACNTFQTPETEE